MICGDDGQPLFAAIVGVDNGTDGVQTDMKGKFSFKNVCAGSHHLKVSLIGYNGSMQSIQVSSNRTVKHLKAEEIHLKEVHVEAEQIHKEEVETVTKAEISGAGNFSKHAARTWRMR